MSDRTLPRSLRMIEGYGVHSLRLINAAGETTLSKANVGQGARVVDTNDTGAFIDAAKTRQWDREKFVRTLA